MTNWLISRDINQFNIYVPRFRLENYYAEFEIIVNCLQGIKWKVYKRYSEFKKLNEDLLKTDSKYKLNFPPKKSFHKTTDKFLNQRRQSLQLYLNEVVSQCDNILPRSLAYFLDMDKYEIHGITTAMAKTFFECGNMVLKKNNLFEMSVLQIYAINQRMVSPVPTNLYQRTNEDFGNVLEVVESLQKVKIVPTSVMLSNADHGYGTSNIKVSSLTFDISIFSSVIELHINSLEISNLRGLHKMNSTVEHLRVQYCLKSLEELLFSDLAYKESNIEHLQKFDGPLRCATDINLSHNSIAEIDISIVMLRQVQLLNLSHNQISDINHMQYLTFLTELDLSYNNLHMCQTCSLSTKLGSIKRLCLSGNKLSTLTIVDRMFSLEYLDVSDNQLHDSFALLSLCRLSCLETLAIQNNPICSLPNFNLVIFDIFLDRCQNIHIITDISLTVPPNINEYRVALKVAILAQNSPNRVPIELIGEPHCPRNTLTRLSYIDIQSNQIDSGNINTNSILDITDVYNIFIYWFFLATGQCINPKKLLWVTEMFAPNSNVRPSPVLLVTSGTHTPNMLKCRLFKWFDSVTNSYDITIQIEDFLELSTDAQHVIVGADKSFLRLDMAQTNRDLFLTNNVSDLDAFLCRLYHVDEETTCFGNPRIVHLNEEDRLEMMRRFVNMWRIEMAANVKRNCENVEIHIDSESEFLLLSRAMLEMKNGFQILLTVVVTREILYLVDERIYDWPDFNKHPNLSDLSSGTSCSPYTSSCGQFPFLRTNAYFLCQLEVCLEVSTTTDHINIIDSLCPIFRYPVKITFNSSHHSVKDPLKLLFENEQKTGQLYRLVHQQRENTHHVNYTSPDDIEITLPQLPLTDLPCHLRHLSSSYAEIRLCLSLSYPRLSHLAQSPPERILTFCRDILSDSAEDKISGIIWSNFIYVNFDMNDETSSSKESPGLIYLSSSGIHVLYEVEQYPESDPECDSDPEVDQPEVSSETTKLETVSIRITEIFKTYVGLNHQWLTLCHRCDQDGSETGRLVLIMRNKHMCKHMISWINALIKDHRELTTDPSIVVLEPCHMTVDDDHKVSGANELIHQIQRTSRCEDIDLVHYCSLQDVRFDPSMLCRALRTSSNDKCSWAVVLTTVNIVIIQHNICHYPIREYAPATIGGDSSRHSPYQVLLVVPLFDCLQLQLPGYDRSILIIIIKYGAKDIMSCNSSSTTLKIQLSISCQREQKCLIDKIRQQRSKYLQLDTPIPITVC